jgi:hypothetical protein
MMARSVNGRRGQTKRNLIDIDQDDLNSAREPLQLYDALELASECETRSQRAPRPPIAASAAMYPYGAAIVSDPIEAYKWRP